MKWQTADIEDLVLQGHNGVLISNPPYGERLGEVQEAEYITKIIGEKMAAHPSWSAYLISSLPNFEEMYGKKATKKRKLFNGFIRTDYYQYWGKPYRS